MISLEPFSDESLHAENIRSILTVISSAISIIMYTVSYTSTTLVSLNTRNFRREVYWSEQKFSVCIHTHGAVLIIKTNKRYSAS